MPDLSLTGAFFDDSRWHQTVQVFKHGETSNSDGYAIPGDDDNTGDLTVDAIIRPSRARKYEFIREGRADSGEYLMIVEASENVEQGDEVAYRDERYNIQSPESDILDGFTVFELHEVVE